MATTVLNDIIQLLLICSESELKEEEVKYDNAILALEKQEAELKQQITGAKAVLELIRSIRRNRFPEIKPRHFSKMREKGDSYAGSQLFEREQVRTAIKLLDAEGRSQHFTLDDICDKLRKSLNTRLTQPMRARISSLLQLLKGEGLIVCNMYDEWRLIK